MVDVQPDGALMAAPINLSARTVGTRIKDSDPMNQIKDSDPMLALEPGHPVDAFSTDALNHDFDARCTPQVPPPVITASHSCATAAPAVPPAGARRRCKASHASGS